jgi:hypothetical protein
VLVAGEEMRGPANGDQAADDEARCDQIEDVHCGHRSLLSLLADGH